MQKMVSILCCLLFLNSCSKEVNVKTIFSEDSLNLNTHMLKAYAVEQNTKYLVVFESGLGDDHSVWQTKKVAEQMSKEMDVVIYDRAGYGKSTIDLNPRTIDRLRTELEAVVDHYANGRKVVLVGHSIGGLIIRDYAIKNPNKTAALLFIDPSHENFNEPTQEIVDLIYNAFLDAYGSNFGGTKEVKELIEDFTYSSSLPHLPNVPVTVLTSMKNDQANTTSDQTYHKTRQDWYNAHELLKNGVNDFLHISTINSGHYIMTDEPNLVMEKLNLLIAKLP